MAMCCYIFCISIKVQNFHILFSINISKFFNDKWKRHISLEKTSMAMCCYIFCISIKVQNFHILFSINISYWIQEYVCDFLNKNIFLKY